MKRLCSLVFVEHCELFVFSFSSIFITKPNYEFVFPLFVYFLKLETTLMLKEVTTQLLPEEVL